MKTRTLIFVTSLAFCGFAVTGVAWQSRRLDALRGESHRLQEQLEAARTKAESNGAVAGPVVSPSEELLSLRNEVSQLTRRERELAGVPSENERLRTQVASARTNTATQLPANVFRKSVARNLGRATPDATLETFLWAIRNRDLPVLLGCFTPELAARIDQHREATGESVEQFFEASDGMPVINVVERVREADGQWQYRVEMALGSSGPELILFRLINGEWRMEH